MNIIQLIGFSLEDDQSGRFLFVKLQTLACTKSGRTGLNLDGSVRQSGRSIVVSGQTTTVSRTPPLKSGKNKHSSVTDRRYNSISSAGQLDESFEFADTRGVAHFTQGLGLDLADALTRHLELAADFLEGAAVAILEAEALFEHLAFAFGESVQHILDLILEHREAGLFHRVIGGFVFDEVAERGVVGISDGRLERDRLLGHL